MFGQNLAMSRRVVTALVATALFWTSTPLVNERQRPAHLPSAPVTSSRHLLGVATNVAESNFDGHTAATGPSVLQLADLSVAGCFLTYGTGTGNWTTDYPVTYRRIKDVRRYFQLGGDGHIYESTEPTLRPCRSAIDTLNVSSRVRDWGTFTVNGSSQYPNTSGSGHGSVRGLFYDTTTGKLIVTWSGTYVNLPSGLNTFAVLSINDDSGTVSVDGCYAPPYRMPYTAGGVIDIPAAFISTYLPAGRRLGFLGGIFASATSGNNYGPGVLALSFPPANACAAGRDYPIPAGTKLAEYAMNDAGATCGAAGSHESGSNLGCMPSPRQLTPHPAIMEFTGYSYDLYPADWDPYGSPKRGYFADDTGWRFGWYDDGVKAGGVVPFTQSAGWIKTTISSTSGPGRVMLGSIDTHDGFTLNPGDAIVIQTCTPRVDAGCSTTNLLHVSVAVVDTVDKGTRAITYHAIDNSGCSTCTNTPVVGGVVYGGPVYPHGSPGWMRSTLRLQLYDPGEFATVTRGAPPYTPAYSEETSLYAMGVTTLGDPAAGHGLRAGFVAGDSQVVTSVITDPAAHQIVIFVRSAQLFNGMIPRSLGIVLNVSDAR